ncbi:hypothetical protein Bca52824_080389 [Brassica carinata]|uniref:Secreted protein n=1 Tax=Brassica carinata TaxID=52824 RepID=A0A8X7PGQ2_BRACI|nr:hypothetical protein Bca52824_080389 [Brassica carinata]
MWVVVVVCIFSGAPTVDLAVPKRWEIPLLVLSRGCVWGVSSFGVVDRVREVPVTTRISLSLNKVSSCWRCSSMKAVRSDEWIGVSLAIGFLASSKVVLIRRSNLQFIITNDGTACLWTPPRAAEAVGLYPVLQGLRVPFSPGARGNWRLHPLIPIHWAIGITLTPVHL